MNIEIKITGNVLKSYEGTSDLAKIIASDIVLSLEPITIKHLEVSVHEPSGSKVYVYRAFGRSH